MYLVCWNHDCRQTYPMSDFKMEQTNVKCTRCGDTVISPSGKVQITGLPNVMPTIDPEEVKDEHEGYELINCSECGKDKWVEEGTWALDKGMCEPCYCAYKGG